MTDKGQDRCWEKRILKGQIQYRADTGQDGYKIG